MNDDPPTETDKIAFPRLDASELAALKPLAISCSFADGQTVFQAGDADVDLFVVESGAVEILNPSNENQHVVTHGPGEFAGDLDLLTRRPVLVTCIARGRTTLLRVPSQRLRETMNKIPHVGEKLLIAAQERRRLEVGAGVLGLNVVGPGKCRDTMRIREFLFKNFVPFVWHDSASEQGKMLFAKWGSPQKSPVVELAGGRLLNNPSLRELAQGTGVWRELPTKEVDLAIIGAGPAGMAAAVYAASEGVSTIILDQLGPGGQAGGSSKIENFMGFPSGLSGAELAMRSVIQMLKFGAQMVAPVTVERIEPAAKPDDLHALHLDYGTVLRAHTILIATGVDWRRLDAEGAERFEAAGIHYVCTSVEGMLYDKQDVAVVGAGNSAGQAAMFLADYCRDRKVHMLIQKHLGPGMSDYLMGRIRSAPNISLHEGVEIAAVHGERRLESVTLRVSNPDGAPREMGDACETLLVSAVFVFIGADPGCSWLPTAIARNTLGYVLTGTDALLSGRWPLREREPCTLETTAPGILAAGDIRAGSTKRVGFAVGDGSLAITCVHKLTAMRE
jgi:thioredoxin reductase (NADPH)